MSDAAGEPFDLLIHGGRLFDPAGGTWRRASIGVRDGVISALDAEPEASAGAAAGVRVDARGAMILPGLTDLHVHSWPEATFWGIDTDAVSLPHGVTTTVDAGSAGAANFDGLARRLRAARTRALAFVNLARDGLAHPYGELLDMSAADVEGAVRVARAHPDLVTGFKLRASPNTVGDNAAAALAAVRRAADETGLRVMVHVSDAPPDLDLVLAHLRAGDILTHCFTPYGNCVVGRASVRAALARGVLLDVGHGSGSFSFPAARAWLGSGEALPIISTDLHSRSVLGPAFDMLTVMTKFLASGWPLEQVLAAATLAPARALGHEAAPVVGAPADLCMLELQERPLALWDSRGVEVEAPRRLSCLLTVRAGRVVHAAPGVRVHGA